MSGSTVTASVPGTSSLFGVGGVLISTAGNSISISGENYTNFEPYPIATGTTVYANSAGSWFFEPFYLPGNISGGRVNRILSFNSVTSSILRATSANFASGSTGSASISYTYGNTVGIYSLGAGTNSTRMESVWSNSFSVGFSTSASVSLSGGASLNVSLGATMSYINSIDSNGNYTTTTLGSSTTRTTGATSMNSSIATAFVSSMAAMLSGSIVIPIGFNTTVLPGNYWFAQAWSSSSTTAGTAPTTVPWPYNSQFCMSIPNVNATAASLRIWGQTANVSNSQVYPGAGVWSATSGTMPATVAFSNIVTFGSNIRNYWNFVNSTI
jgi:hypothetical protein